MTPLEFRKWAFRENLWWARYHARLSRNVYCDAASEHEELAKEHYQSARSYLHDIRREMRRHRTMKRAA